MCGIAGMIGGDPGISLAEVATRLSAPLRHRGPDDQGEAVEPGVGLVLVHRRLSILDLSPTGAQPMHSACGRYLVVFNGEIYNFLELRADLEAAGSRFRGSSDTEVLLEGIAHWGLRETLQRADGMFALALWDRERRTLTLARDRVGEKPLYYGRYRGALVFASELKALFALPGFHPAIDRQALTLYLRYNYIPDPWCVFEGFHKLPAGSLLEIPAAAAQMPAAEAWWTLAATVTAGQRNPFTGSAEEAVDALHEVLARSVERRMIADVPLGAFLSGGIDSSTVVALMQAHSARPVKSFSIGFEMDGFDEAPHARAVAEHLGTDHTELYVSPAEARAVIPELPAMYDEPFADSSQIPTAIVSRLARRQVTVAMSGDAGDELFAGYLRYTIAIDLWRRSSRVPAPLRRLAGGAIRALPPPLWDRLIGAARPLLPARLRFGSPGDKLHKLARTLGDREPLALYRRINSLWDEPAAVVRNVTEPPTDYRQPADTTLPLAARMMYLDTRHYLPGDILTKVDRAAMAASLETRIPFLGVEVMDLAWRLPLDYKLRDGTGKWVLRELLARYVPRECFERPKMGFGVPIDSWLRGPLREWAEDLLDEGRLRDAGYFHPEPIRRAWRAHLRGSHNLPYHLWGVLMFESWREHWGY